MGQDRLTSMVGRLLPALNASFPTAIVPTVRAFLAEHAGAIDVEVLLVDYEQEALRPLGERLVPPLPAARLDGSPAGAAFVTQETVLVADEGGLRLFVPISLRAERLGVLAATVPAAHGEPLLDGLTAVAVMLAYVLPMARSYSDLIEMARRERPMELPAEIQWSLLPVQAYTCEEFTVAGRLVPAYQVGGDLFDYAVEPDTLTVSVIDAVGHGLRAAILGSLAVAALRNARRTGLDLVDQIRSADRVLYGQHTGEQFVVALALQIHLADGATHVVNAGQPPPYLLRAGQLTQVELAADLPLGLFDTTSYHEQQLYLSPGDRLVLYSDGVVEAAPPGGEEYGAQRLQGALLATENMPPNETVRQLLLLIRDWQYDEPRDDATLVCLDWRGRSG